MPEHTFPTKGTRPVTGLVMYNFICWLAYRHPEIRHIQSTPRTLLLFLTQQFEADRPDIEPGTPITWNDGFDKLFDETFPQDDFAVVRQALS